MKSIDVSIIILNWNGLENTRKCLDSLLKIRDVNYKVIVVDNGSKNEEAKALKKEYGNKIEVHPLPKNLGFTGGVNYGIKAAQEYNPEFYLLLNNDTEVEKDFLKNLITTARSDKKIGVASPIIFDYDKRDVVVFSGSSINWLTGRIAHHTDRITSVKVCTFITGCCFLIKKELIEKIGVLDDRFFAYFEDNAYSLSATRAGYKCVCDPSAIIYHKGGASTEKTGPFKTYLISRNRILFINNYAPSVVKIYFFVFNFIKLLVAMIIFQVTNQRRRSYAYLKGYIDGTLGRGGLPGL